VLRETAPLKGTFEAETSRKLLTREDDKGEIIGMSSSYIRNREHATQLHITAGKCRPGHARLGNERYCGEGEKRG